MPVPRFGMRQPSSVSASRTAAAIKSSATSPEEALRLAFRRRGLRASSAASAKSLPGKPDFVFMADRILVFCDGDFWHGRNWSLLRKKLARVANADYWLAKIAYNRKRDRRNNRELRRQGWTVIRLWEIDVRRNVDYEAERVYQVVSRKRRRQMSRTRYSAVRRPR
jgi:DNA mismatch endonuclease (patch repair protein)